MARDKSGDSFGDFRDSNSRAPGKTGFEGSIEIVQKRYLCERTVRSLFDEEPAWPTPFFSA